MTNNITTISILTDNKIVITQIYDALRGLVFKTYSEPAYIPKWWGPRAIVTIVDEMNFRPGGNWRFINSGVDGREHVFSGQYRKIIPNELVVYSSEYEAMPGRVSVSKTVFEDQGDKTRMTDTTSFTNKENRDYMLSSDMGTSIEESGERFAELLVKLQQH
jgi:uncharacterized protein YndB with AHSA1/START domain